MMQNLAEVNETENQTIWEGGEMGWGNFQMQNKICIHVSQNLKPGDIKQEYHI